MVKGIHARLLVLVLISLVFVFISTSAVLADGPASVYKVTLTKFELWNGTGWITAFSGTSVTLDIASASGTSTSAGSFLSGLIVPDGTYTKVKVTPSGTFIISGNDGAGSYTTAARGLGNGSTPTLIAALQAECTITVNVAAPNEMTLPTPIVVKDGVPDHRVRVRFDTSHMIQNQGGELYPVDPTPFITISVI